LKFTFGYITSVSAFVVLLVLDFYPGVAEAYGFVEDEIAIFGIGVNAEVA